MIEAETLYLILGLLILSIVLCIIRVFKGPTAPDRVVGLDTNKHTCNC